MNEVTTAELPGVFLICPIEDGCFFSCAMVVKKKGLTKKLSDIVSKELILGKTVETKYWVLCDLAKPYRTSTLFFIHRFWDDHAWFFQA